MRQYPVQCAWWLGLNEKKDFSVDVSNEVQAGETISSVNFTADPDDLTLENETFSGNLCTVTASAPKAAQFYSLTLLVTTGIGKAFEVPLGIAGIDKSK